MAQVSCHSSSQNVGACDLFPYRATERERDIFKIGFFLYRARKMFLQDLTEGKDPRSYASLPTGFGKSLV